MDELLAAARRGKRRAIARLITRIENSEEAAQTAVSALYPHTGGAHVIGVTGPPGAGKSSLVNQLALELRRRELTVGIVAVDPSSPFTGGALLGDRVRMRDLSGDRGVFIRSLAARGNLGGLSQATAAVVKVLDAAGFDRVLVETVGAGQAEVAIADAAHTTIVIEAPGMGDDVQSIKAGILEIADVLVVNKADRPGASRASRSLKMMLQLGPAGGTRHHGRILHTPQKEEIDETVWSIPLLETVATEGEGIGELADAIDAHRAHLQETNDWLKREKERSRREVEQLLQARLMAELAATVPSGEHEQLITAVAQRELDPYTAAARLFTALQGDDGDKVTR
jgi:LAO/AO transport system kinase